MLVQWELLLITKMPPWIKCLPTFNTRVLFSQSRNSSKKNTLITSRELSTWGEKTLPVQNMRLDETKMHVLNGPIFFFAFLLLCKGISKTTSFSQGEQFLLD
jgi:hypothetical protein